MLCVDWRYVRGCHEHEKLEEHEVRLKLLGLPLGLQLLWGLELLVTGAQGL